MKPLEIHVHSFVDLITNSSTEIYISASEKTIESITSLVNGILAAGGSTKKCEDLFDISFDVDGFCSDYDYKYRDDERKDETPEEFMRKEIEMSDYDYRRCARVKVTAKKDSPDAALAARIMSNLCGLFSIDASYNG